MRAFQVFSHDREPDLREIAICEPKTGEIRLKVEACGLNFADLLIADGTYQTLPDLPATLGMEVAGTVDAVGPGVDGIGIGQRVAAYTGHGGLAEHAVVDAARALPLTGEMPSDVAAAMLITYGTAHLGLTRRARLDAGETLLVLGAGGGVGTAAVEIGRRMGARVIAVARGAEKRAAAERAGAHHLIDAEIADLRGAVRALGGCDVLFDPVGGELSRQAARSCNPEGRALLVGFASGTIPRIALNHLLVKNVSLIGYSWSGYLAFAPETLLESLRTLVAWYVDGALSPQISLRLPLERAAEGLERLRRRHASGKIVVTLP